MARTHSKHTEIVVDGDDISEFCNNSNFEVSAKTEDTTTYGKDAEVYDATLKSGACGFSGTYDDDATGPRAILLPLVGTKVDIIHKPEGTGSGKPIDMFEAVITKYTETAPVAGYRQWACEVQPSDDIISNTQT